MRATCPSYPPILPLGSPFSKMHHDPKDGAGMFPSRSSEWSFVYKYLFSFESTFEEMEIFQRAGLRFWHTRPVPSQNIPIVYLLATCSSPRRFFIHTKRITTSRRRSFLDIIDHVSPPSVAAGHLHLGPADGLV